jgi:CheY-like chemotaxis protein
MPAQDGNEIARQIRQEPTLDGSIIVALSGYCAESDREEALDSGADLFLAKPVKMATLREVLSAAHSLHYQLGST